MDKLMSDEQRYKFALIELSRNLGNPYEMRDMSYQSCLSLGRYIDAILAGKSIEQAATEANNG